MDSLMTAPQLGEGQIIDLLVTLYNVDDNASMSSVLNLFYSISPVVNKIAVQSGNYIIFEYATPSGSREALKLHGTSYQGYLINIKPTEIDQIPLHFVQDLQERFGMDCLDPMSNEAAFDLNNTQLFNTTNIAKMNTTTTTTTATPPTTTTTTSVTPTRLRNPLLTPHRQPRGAQKFQPSSSQPSASQRQHQQHQPFDVTFTSHDNTRLNNTLNNTNNRSILDITMTAPSPNLQQRRLYPNQGVQIVSPFDIDSKYKQQHIIEQSTIPAPTTTATTTTATTTTTITQNAAINPKLGHIRPAHYKPIATYDEHIRNRGCWSKFLAFFGWEQ